MEDSYDFENVEMIIDTLQIKSTQVNKFRKFDGITIECEIMEPVNIQNAINEVKAICTEIKAIPFSVEIRKDTVNMFAVQFPELMPHYSNEIITSMYKDDFTFLLNNIKMKDPSLINKPYLIEQMDSIVKHAMKIVCRSTINQYKDSFDNYYNNVKYRARINGIYLEFLEEYLSGGI